MEFLNFDLAGAEGKFMKLHEYFWCVGCSGFKVRISNEKWCGEIIFIKNSDDLTKGFLMVKINWIRNIFT